MQDESERKSHAANILSNNLFLSNCTFLDFCPTKVDEPLSLE